MELGLTDKVVWITGASGGIGRALAEAFGAEGATLALHGHSAVEELATWVATQPWRDRALIVPADVTSISEVDAAAATIRGRFGRIDAAIANAGVWPPDDQPLWELSPERLRHTLEVNLFGAVYTARAFLQSLAATGPRSDGDGASLLFTGSTAARFGERGHSDYAAGKAGLAGLMRSLKNEITHLDPYARVNIVEPGWTVTEMTRRNIQEPGVVERVVRTMPVRQLGRARDIARAALFLSSARVARHISGQILTVAGGMEGRVQWETEEVDAAAILDRLDQPPRPAVDLPD